MLRRLLLFFCLLSIAWAKTPRPLADVPISTPTGQKINLKQYHGKVVLMIVFSLHCDACLQTIQLVGKMQKDYAKYGFQAVAAAGDPAAQVELNQFILRYRPEIPVGYLNQAEIIKLCDVAPGAHPFVPIAMFIDNKDQVRYQFYGDNAFFHQEEHGMRAVVEGLLKQAGANIQFSH